MLSSDLMNLGMSPLVANRTAKGGSGPLTIAAAGTSYASSTKIGATQYLCSCSNADGTKGVGLPTVGGDTGALLADDYIVNNASGSSLRLFASSGVSISVGGTNTSVAAVATHTTITVYPISTTQWIGVGGV